MSQAPQHSDRLDQATSQRLARLQAVPVVTSRLEKQLADAGVGLNGSTVTVRGRWRVIAGAVAAAAAITLMVLLPLVGGSNLAVASPIDLSQLHEDIMAGRFPLTAVATVEEANRQIQNQSRDAPALPGFEDAQIQSCCLANIQGKLVAVAVIGYDDAPVTLVVARGRDFAHAMGETVTVGSREFFAHEVNGVQMVMGNKGDLWLCVMGDQPVDVLADVAAGIELVD